MAPNKPTAYGLFMQEYIKRKAAEGHNISMASAQSLCSEPWKALTDEQRHDYKVKAKSTLHCPEKMSCDGISLKKFEREEHVKNQAEKLLQHNIDEMINTLKRSVDLEETNFTLIHANMLCKTQQGEYVPAELAIVHFSLYDGEKTAIHYIIDPGKLPSGYLYEADKHVKATHLISCHKESASKKFAAVHQTTVLQELKTFVSRRYPHEPEPIFFATSENMHIVKGVIQALNKSAEYEQGVLVRISSVDGLFARLKNRCAEESGQPDRMFQFTSSALEELNRDVFEFQTGISCKFHEFDEEGSERFNQCSLHVVRRTMYVICDHCAPLLDIPLIPGRHCPPDVVAPALASAGGANYAGSHFQSDNDDEDAYETGADDATSWATVPSTRTGRRHY